mgnify:FL=1
MDNLSENLDILDEIFKSRQERLGVCTKEIKEKLNDMSIEEMQEILNESIENTEKKNQTLNDLDLLIENYEIKMSSYIEEAYKQCFKDAFSLFMECKQK